MGTDEPSVFDTTASYEQSRADYYQGVFERWVAAPFRILWDDNRGKFGLLIVTFYVLMGTVGVILVPQPDTFQGPRLLGPFNDPNHILGTDGLGQDLLALMVHATPPMLKMILAGALFGNFMGVLWGLLAGYYGGMVDKVIMTFSDTIKSIPGIPLLLILAAIFQPKNPFVIGIMINITGWATASRGIRAQVFPIATEEHVEAARAQGQPVSVLLVKEILPHLLPLVFIGFLGGATTVVTASVGLYFLGILPFTTQNWGVTLNFAVQESGALYDPSAAHWLLVPLVTLTLLNVGFTLLAQAFDQVFNPRVRARHRSRQTGPEDEEDEERLDTQASGNELISTR